MVTNAPDSPYLFLFSVLRMYSEANFNCLWFCVPLHRCAFYRVWCSPFHVRSSSVILDSYTAAVIVMSYSPNAVPSSPSALALYIASRWPRRFARAFVFALVLPYRRLPRSWYSKAHDSCIVFLSSQLPRACLPPPILSPLPLPHAHAFCMKPLVFSCPRPPNPRIFSLPNQVTPYNYLCYDLPRHISTLSGAPFFVHSFDAIVSRLKKISLLSVLNAPPFRTIPDLDFVSECVCAFTSVVCSKCLSLRYCYSTLNGLLNIFLVNVH